MTPVEALNQAVAECHAHLRYIWEQHGQRYSTPQEVTRQGGAECSGQAIWTIDRAYELCPCTWYWWVEGTVVVQGDDRTATVCGHAWAELRQPDEPRLWADPTWDIPCRHPGDRAYTGRVPIQAYPYNGECLGEPTEYVQGAR